MIVREGYPFIIVPLVVTAILFFTGYWIIALIFAAITAFMLLFFRDPHRAVVTDADLVVAPADGRVTKIAKLDPTDPASPTIVSIFLSVFNVHINRAPVAGKITNITYKKGSFVIATREDASQVNEQNALTIENDRVRVVCTQIAGVVARRIVCWKRAGDTVALGERFGMIKFSSRTDLVLPANVEITTEIGARVRGGVSIIGKVR